MTRRLDDELQVDQVVEHVHVVEPHRVEVHHLYGDRLA